MYKLYNLEANFGEFINSLSISRKTQKRYLVFFRSFLNWLNYILNITLSDGSLSQFLTYLSPNSLTKYQKFLGTSKISKALIHERLAALEKFKSYIELNPDRSIKNLKMGEFLSQKALVDEFIADLEERSGTHSTIRSYRSDLGQFLTFINDR